MSAAARVPSIIREETVKIVFAIEDKASCYQRTDLPITLHFRCTHPSETPCAKQGFKLKWDLH